MNTVQQVIAKIEELVVRYTEYQMPLDRPLYEIIGLATVHDVSNSIILYELKELLSALKTYEVYGVDLEQFLNFKLKELQDHKNEIIGTMSAGTPISMVAQGIMMAIREFETTLSLKDIFFED